MIGTIALFALDTILLCCALTATFYSYNSILVLSFTVLGTLLHFISNSFALDSSLLNRRAVDLGNICELLLDRNKQLEFRDS